jgi:D-alanine-D-alanine ligase
MRIAVLANLKENAPEWENMPPDQWDDLDSPKTINSLIGALGSGGHEAEFFEASLIPPFSLVEKLTQYKPDLCFNIAEGHFGDSRESQIPAVLEALRIPYTGSKVLTLTLALDKPMTKRVLTYHGLPTPEFQVFEQPDEPIDEDLLGPDGELQFPLFVKPSREGTSVGVTADNIVRTVAELRNRVDQLSKRYNQTILVEHYIKGREITIGMIGNLNARAARRMNDRTTMVGLPEELTFFPPLEINMAAYVESEKGLYTNRMKVELAEDDYYLCPASLGPEMLHDLQLLAASVFRVTGCKDVARVDFRLDEDRGNKPYILEVNPLPGLNPDYSDLCVEAKAHGWAYERLINTMVELAAERQGVVTTKV